MVIQTKRRKATLSISINPELKVLAEEIAKENKTTPSGFISQYLEEIARKRMIKLMEEGYREMADENRLLAEQSLFIASETWPREDIGP